MSDNDSDEYEDYSTDEEEVLTPQEQQQQLKDKEIARKAKLKLEQDEIEKRKAILKERKDKEREEKQAKLTAIKEKSEARRKAKQIPEYYVNQPNPYGENVYGGVNPYVEDDSFALLLEQKETEIAQRHASFAVAMGGVDTDEEEEPAPPPNPFADLDAYLGALEPTLPYAFELSDSSEGEYSSGEEEATPRILPQSKFTSYPDPTPESVERIPFQTKKNPEGIGVYEPSATIDDDVVKAHREEIQALYTRKIAEQDVADAVGVGEFGRFSIEAPKVKFDGFSFTIDRKDATPEFLANIEEHLSTPESEALTAQALIDKEKEKEIKKKFYAKGYIPDFPWTKEQSDRYLPEVEEGGFSKKSERERDEEDKILAGKYGAYDPTANAKVNKLAFLDDSSDDEAEELKWKEKAFMGMGLELASPSTAYVAPDSPTFEITEEDRAHAIGMGLQPEVERPFLKEPRPFEKDPKVWNKWEMDKEIKYKGEGVKLGSLLKPKLELVIPPTVLSDGLITDEDEAEFQEEMRQEEEKLKEMEKQRLIELGETELRPDTEARETMGKGKKGKRKQEVIFPKMPKSAYDFSHIKNPTTRAFLEQQRDAMLKLKTKEGKQFTSMYPRDSAGNVIKDEEILPWLIEEKEEKAKEKALARKEATKAERQKDYDEDRETFLTDKKLFNKKVKAKRATEEKKERAFTNTSFGKLGGAFNMRRRKKPPPPKKGEMFPAPTSPLPQAQAVAPTFSFPFLETVEPLPPPRSPSPEPRKAKVVEKKLHKAVSKTQEVRVKERVKKRVKRKVLVPQRKAPTPPKPTPKPRPAPRPTPAPRPPKKPSTPQPTPAPRPKPKPRPATIKKRATRSDKGTHHKWSDGRETSATYKRNKAKGVDWSAVRCRASTCWKVGDRKDDAKGKGAFASNKSSGEYKHQLREKPKKKKKKEERKQEDGWF